MADIGLQADCTASEVAVWPGLEKFNTVQDILEKNK